MGLLDCVASPEERDHFDESNKPFPRRGEHSRSDHDISRRRSKPLFSSQTSLKNIRDVDFWRTRVLRFLFSPEGREDVSILKVPFKQLGHPSVTDFIEEIPPELFSEFLNQKPPDEGIFKDDKVFWVHDGIAEPGTFKWQGVIDNVPIIGVQLDRKKSVPFGIHDGKGLFYCKPGHRALVPEHEVTPYKKFLRNFLGLPPRLDSLVGMRESVRFSEKALAAKNSKPGDKVYLPKEKKWATVQWIGKIDGETVVDLVYEPDNGKPISPDEACISRSLSLADFIGELASEPNTPIPVQIQQQQQKQEQIEVQRKSLVPVQTKFPSPKPVPPEPPKLPLSPSSSDEHIDDSGSSEEDSDEDSDSGTGESEENSSDGESYYVDDEKITEAPAVVATVPRQISNEEKIPDTPTMRIDQSPGLPSPKQKGFFGFVQNKKQKRPKSTIALNVEQKSDFKSLQDLKEPTTPPPRLRNSTLFGSLRFGKGKKTKKESPPKKEEQTPKKEAKSPATNKKSKLSSSWGALFKSKSKTQLPKEDIEEPRSPTHECFTPVDDMIPPDKIPTPPPFPPPSQLPNESYNERRIERPDFLNLPVTPPSKNQDDDESSQDEQSVQQNEKEIGVVSLDPDIQSSESEQSDTDEEEGHIETQNVSVQMHVPSPKNSHQVSGKQKTEEIKITTLEREVVQRIPMQEQNSTGNDEDGSKSPPYTPGSVERFKETKIRNRPTSFGSFLRRIKNIKPSPVDAPENSSGPSPPTRNFKNKEKSPEQEREKVPQPINNRKDSVRSETSQFSTDVSDGIDDNREPATVEMGINRTLVKPPVAVKQGINTVEGNQEGIELELLDVNEQTPPVKVSPSVPTSEPPIRKTSKSKSAYTFSFTGKRKTSTSTPQVATTPIQKEEPRQQNSDVETNNENRENVDPHHEEDPHKQEEEKERKQSKPSSFRNSFKRTFSLTRNKKRSSIDQEPATPTSPTTPTSQISKPRPVTVYVDNNEVTQARGSLRKKRPTSLVVDIKPWNTRHGSAEGDIYSSPSSDESPMSPSNKSPNSAILPKPSEVNIPKHRIFTTPSIFIKKTNKKSDNEPLIPTTDTSMYRKWNEKESSSPPYSPSSPEALPTRKQPPPPPTESPPPLPPGPPPVLSRGSPPALPTAPPPVLSPRSPPVMSSRSPPVMSPRSPPVMSPRSPPVSPPGSPSPLLTESSPTKIISETPFQEPTIKLKSALKQRKEIDSIPKGLKVNDRVLWYSGKGPIPGTVLRLFKDGTDKYTAMVKFDREVPDEPLRLTREGDAYIVTVEELITPDMFEPTYANQNEVGIESVTDEPVTPITPPAPSVRFDGVTEDPVPNVVVTEESYPEEEEHDLPPPFQEEEVTVACGFRRGIQSRDKSCCLETILFSMFYTTNAFDITTLFANSHKEDLLTRTVRNILRREIVDPLRREGFCSWMAVKKLRDAVKPLSDEWQTLSTDAEVMMFILFDRALKLQKFISYSNDMSDYMHQLVVDTKDLSKSTTIQHLFETSLQMMDKLKLKTVPTPVLILEMPRSNDQLMQYKAVIPNMSLTVSHILEGGPRLCICGAVAKYDCSACAANVGRVSIVYCDSCKSTADAIHFNLTHEAQLYPLNQPIIFLDLSAIICVKSGHYFSFVKCGQDQLSPWVFFDGAELENPKVCIEQNLSMWLDRLEKYPGRYQDALQYPLLTHILQDSHICIYQPREKSSSV